MEKIEVNKLKKVNISEVADSLGYSSKLGEIVRFANESSFSSLEVLIGSGIYIRDRTGKIDISNDLEVRLLRKKKITNNRGSGDAYITFPDKPYKKMHNSLRVAGWKWTDYLNNSVKTEFIKLEKISEEDADNGYYSLNLSEKLDFVIRGDYSEHFRAFWDAISYTGVNVNLRKCSPQHHTRYQHLALRFFNNKTGEYSDLIKFKHIISTAEMRIVWGKDDKKQLDEDGNTLYNYSEASLTETFALV